MLPSAPLSRTFTGSKIKYLAGNGLGIPPAEAAVFPNKIG
jgi:hypothetical protein